MMFPTYGEVSNVKYSTLEETKGRANDEPNLRQFHCRQRRKLSDAMKHEVYFATKTLHQ